MQGIPVAYDTALPQNGVNMNVGTPLSVPYTRFGAQPVGSYAMPGSQWVSGYMMAQPMAQVDDQVSQSVCFTNASIFFFHYSSLSHYVHSGVDQMNLFNFQWMHCTVNKN